MDNILLNMGLFLLTGLFGLRAAFALLGFLFFNKGDQKIASRKLYITLISVFLGFVTFIAWIKVAI